MDRDSEGAPHGRHEPILNAPAGVVWAIALLVGIHAGLELLDEGSRDWWKLAAAFIPVRYTGSALELPGGSGAAVWSFVTHQFIHADWAHVGLNCAWLLAFGGAVATRIGILRFTLLGIASGIAGACLFLALRWGELTPMAGASGAVSGLMAGSFRFFFAAIDRGGLGAFREAPMSIPRMSIAATLGDGRVRTMVIFFLVINAVTAVAAPLFTSAGGIAWEAHIGGFAFGLLAFAWFDPWRPALMRQYEDPFRPTLH
jgi:membrane associated rhomboid family serine protease